MVVADSNPALSVAQIFKEDDLTTALHTTTEELSLTGEPNQDEFLRKPKNSTVDEGEGLKQALLEVARNNICCRKANILAFGDNLGLLQLLQREKHGRNQYVNIIMDQIFQLARENEWNLRFRWMPRT